MLVTFTTKAHADITMFGDIATRLLKMMGHSGTVPGALKADDIPAALQRLEAGIAAAAPEPAPAPDAITGEQEVPVGIGLRAWPLMELLRAAASEGRDVQWNGH